MFAEVTTRAGWVEDREQIRGVLNRFTGKVFALVLSLTRQSIDAVGLERIEMLMDEAKSLGIAYSVRCPIGPGSPIPRDVLALEAMNSRSGFVSVVPDVSLLERLGNSDEAQPYLLPEPPLRRRCAELFEFVVVAGGDCFPCLPGAGIPELCLGSLDREPALQIMKRAMTNPRHLRLWKEGPFHLYQSIRNSEASVRLSRGYADACHFHRQALRDSRMSRVVASQIDLPAPTAPGLFGELAS
jgi:hypothetical protein